MHKYTNALQRYYRLFGIKGVVAAVWTKVVRRPIQLRQRHPGIAQPVHLRIGTTDPAVFRQVLVERQYDYRIQPAPEVIIDAGANIGLSAVFFANLYPDAIIVAVEPVQSNFEMLQRNAAPYKRIVPVKGAIWKSNGTISLVDSGEGHHGFQTADRSATDAAPGSVRAMTIDALMAEMRLTRVDVLKIDIEGSEKEVFENCAPWIEKVGTIMAELHEHLKPGCEKAFAAATIDFTHSVKQGETEIRSRAATHIPHSASR